MVQSALKHFFFIFWLSHFIIFCDLACPVSRELHSRYSLQSIRHYPVNMRGSEAGCVLLALNFEELSFRKR